MKQAYIGESKIGKEEKVEENLKETLISQNQLAIEKRLNFKRDLLE